MLKMISGNEVLKFMFLILQSSYIVLISLIDHCNIYIQGDIIFALLVVSCTLQSCGDPCGYSTYGLVHDC